MSQDSRRQKLRRSISFWLIDGAYETAIKRLGEKRADSLLNWWGPWVEEPGLKTLCLLFGHEPIADCGIPEHDFCAYCRKGMPGAAPRASQGVAT